MTIRRHYIPQAAKREKFLGLVKEGHSAHHAAWVTNSHRQTAQRHSRIYHACGEDTAKMHFHNAPRPPVVDRLTGSRLQDAYAVLTKETTFTDRSPLTWPLLTDVKALVIGKIMGITTKNHDRLKRLMISQTLPYSHMPDERALPEEITFRATYCVVSGNGTGKRVVIFAGADDDNHFLVWRITGGNLLEGWKAFLEHLDLSVPAGCRIRIIMNRPGPFMTDAKVLPLFERTPRRFSPVKPETHVTGMENVALYLLHGFAMLIEGKRLGPGSTKALMQELLIFTARGIRCGKLGEDKGWMPDPVVCA